MYRKFLWLSENRVRKNSPTLEVQELQMDELETIEHTKLKPLSILLFVNEKGALLEAQVARMPSKGRLSTLSRVKYGIRPDERRKVLFETTKRLSQTIQPLVIKTDGNWMYASAIKKHWPSAKHQVFVREKKEKLRERLHETKQKKKFDPLFRVNHMCARFRADMRRLTRRSWCTTKKPENLQRHLDLYLSYQKA